MAKIIIEVSARHVHVSKDDLDILFGENYQLKPIKELSQKNEFASAETVDIKSENGEIKKLRILGPERTATQVELTRTDAYFLKIDPPVKECTRCVGEPAEKLKIIGPKGEIERDCAIIAHRHIHASPEKAQEHNLKEGDLISVKSSGTRPLTFHQVLVRVDPNFDFQMHIDTDEANAAGIQKIGEGEILN